MCNRWADHVLQPLICYLCRLLVAPFGGTQYIFEVRVSMKELRVTYMRGGTSKGAYIDGHDLPTNPQERDAVILKLYGSPDSRQIDGLGGADPLTSKVAIVSKSERDDADVDYTFGYVGITDPVVDYEGNCGNMSAGVGIFAIMRDMVTAQEGTTVVRIFNTNTNKVIESHIPMNEDGSVKVQGDFAIDGVPGTAAKITLFFLEPAGSKTGKLLPTGNVKDVMTLSNGQELTVSLVDAANPAIFVKAEDLGYKGTELPVDSEQDGGKMLATWEEIRRKAAVMMGLAKTEESASGAVPKICMISKPQDYVAIDGRQILADNVDIVSRTKALAVMHKAYAVTGGICTAVASLIPGTVANEVVSDRAKETNTVTLAHPGGVLDFAVDLVEENGNLVLRKAGVARTARPIMDGIAYITEG